MKLVGYDSDLVRSFQKKFETISTSFTNYFEFLKLKNIGKLGKIV